MAGEYVARSMTASELNLSSECSSARRMVHFDAKRPLVSFAQRVDPCLATFLSSMRPTGANPRMGDPAVGSAEKTDGEADRVDQVISRIPNWPRRSQSWFTQCAVNGPRDRVVVWLPGCNFGLSRLLE